MVIEHHIGIVRSVRDLRASIVGLAVALANSHPSNRGRLVIGEVLLSEGTLSEEWNNAVNVLDRGVRNRLSYCITETSGSAFVDPRQHVSLGRPNYRYEILRRLLHARFEKGSTTVPVGVLVEDIGVSETPIRTAVQQLRRFGLLAANERRVELALPVPELSWEFLSAAEATPHILKFRFSRGSQIKSPQSMLKRARQIVSGQRSEWRNLALSGVPAAQRDVKDIDIAGVPRIELLLRAGVNAFFDADVMHRFADGLELEENRFATSPIVLSITRSKAALERVSRIGGVRYAAKCDVFVSLLAARLGDQARQYARSQCLD